MIPPFKIERKTGSTVSWPILIAAMLVIGGSLAFLHDGVLYTEGEIMQGMFQFLSMALITITLVIAACGARRAAMWLLMGAGGSLLLWQCRQHQRWLFLHEDVLGAIRYVTEEKKHHGSYPADLSGYPFRHPEFADHLGYSPSDPDSFGMSYFLNDSGISYWYYSDSGFGYYPD
ncbi:MAG: hypothetical protein QM755_14555 [Luteolibacter sp.]